jgi:thiol-disulfide isomerase/thioredoxin
MNPSHYARLSYTIGSDARVAVRVRCGLALVAALLPVLAAAATNLTGAQRATEAGRTLLGTAAPRLHVQTIDGQDIDLGKLYGHKAVYLKFWATWCVPCREQMPHLERTFRGAGSDLAVIAVDVGFNDTMEDVRAYRRSMGLTLPIVLDEDGRLGAAFNLRVTPQHIVIGRDGRILYVGHLADAPLEDALRLARSAAPAAKAPVAGEPARSTAATRHYRVGDQLSGFSVNTLGGESVHVPEPGKPTVIAFLSPWCESYLAESRPQLSANCRAAREQLEAHAADPGVRWLGVASGLWATADDLAGYRDKYHVAIPLTLDDSGRLFHAFRVMSVPTLFLIDPQGRIARRLEGAEAGSAEAVRALFTQPR